MLHETIRNDDFLAQHSVATLLQHCFQWFRHPFNIAVLCCAKNGHCESSRVKAPLVYADSGIKVKAKGTQAAMAKPSDHRFSG